MGSGQRLTTLTFRRTGSQLCRFTSVENVWKPNGRALYLNFVHLRGLHPGLSGVIAPALKIVTLLMTRTCSFGLR